MVSERNRIKELVEYIESHGIQVNIGKNRARGNKGYFKVKNEKFRIDITKGLENDSILRTLVHEFAHYIHYCNDKTLKSLEFIIDDKDELILNELIELTVESIPKENIQPLFKVKNDLKQEINRLANEIKNLVPSFKLSEPNKIIESKINKKPYKYLLKHDVVKVVDFLSVKIFRLSELESYEDDLEPVVLNYLKLKSCQRKLNKISTKISKLNKYYNSPTELFARSIEMFVFNPDIVKAKAPNLMIYYQKALDNKKILMLNNIVNICI